MDPTPQALIEHAAFARALAQSLLGDVHSAEDVVQDSWVAALERPPTAGAPPRAWLTRVVQRFAWRRVRSSDRRRTRESLVARPEALAAVDEDLARAEMLRRITDAVLALEEPYRSTVLLRFYEGLDASAIARRTATPEATVRSRLQRALAQLRGRLDREHGGDRRAWSAGLAALVGRDGTGATAAAVGAGAAMITMTKAFVAAATVVTLVLVWRLREAHEPNTRGSQTLAAAELVAPVAGEPSPQELTGPSDVESRSPLVPSTAASTALGALEVHVTWERDGRPAAAEELRLLAWRHASGDRLRRAFTDADGRCHIEGLLPGHLSLGSAHGADASTEVAAGETTRLEVSIPRGFTARGKVVDAHGAPVGGARLWLSEYFNHENGSLVETTRADGSFELVDVPEARYLGAIAAGYAPAHMELLAEHQAADPLQDVEITLTLNGPGGALDLRVLGLDGAAVSDAYARVVGQTLPTRRVGNRYLRSVPTFDAWSDERGLTSIDGLQPGEATIAVRAAGMAAWSGSATIEAGRRTTLDVTLSREAIVTGTVRDAAGEPVADASVFLDAEYDPLRPSARSGADGVFALAGLPSGELSLRARAELGSASMSVHVDTAGRATWDPVLSSGRILTGRVVDHEGAPLVGWTVQAMLGTHSGWRAQAETDAAGAFRMVDVRSEPLELSLYRDLFAERFPTLQRNVATDESEVLFQVGRDDLCTVAVTGRILDPQRRPIAGANVAFWPLGSWYGSGAESNVHGDFRAEHLPPGTYEVSLGFPELPSLFFGRITVAPEEVRALGEIVLQPPGTVHVTIEGAELAGRDEFERFSFEQLDGEGHSHWAASATAAEARTGVALQPGGYALLASGRAGIANMRVPFELAPGETTTVDLVPRPGRYVRAIIQVPTGTTIPDWVQSSVRDGAGERIAESLGQASPERKRTHYLQLAPGTYELAAEASDGRRVHEFFEVTLEGAPQPLEFTWPLR